MGTVRSHVNGRSAMILRKSILLFLLVALTGFGCETVILKQDIPVSTNPMGAKIYANGNYVGKTPATVSLERTRDHIITLVKDDYRQADVAIQRRYQSEKVLMNAVRSGINAGTFFKDTRMGVNSGFSSSSRAEETGEAYLLVPPVVRVDLVPVSGAVSSGPPQGPRRGGAAASDAPDSQVLDSDYPQEQKFTGQDAVRAGVVAGAAAAAAQVKPIEKKWETSSSMRTYLKPDGSVVRESSGTSVGVSVNPLGLLNLIDKFMR